MSGYPLKREIFTGSLHGSWPASAVFITLLGLADEAGLVLESEAEILAMTGWPESLWGQGIALLSTPDPMSRSSVNAGRRIEVYGDGWRIVGWPWTAEFDFRKEARPSGLRWAEIRGRIFERDDYTCKYCGERGGKLECDHVIPVSRGGSSDDWNLVTACLPCNRSKRDKTPEEWRS